MNQDIIIESKCGCTVTFIAETDYELCHFVCCSLKHALNPASGKSIQWHEKMITKAREEMRLELTRRTVSN